MTAFSTKFLAMTYPASKCTAQNMYTCVCADLVVIVSLRTALGSLKEERKKMKTNNLRGRRFRFITLETSVSRAKGIFKLRKSPDHSEMAEMSKNAETTKIYSASLRVAILICDVEQVISATRFQPKVAAILNRGHPYM